MIIFKKSFRKLLPYDRQQYQKFLSADDIGKVKWYGISFQLPGAFEGNPINLNEYLITFRPLFEEIISETDTKGNWIVSHERKDLSWFPDEDDTLSRLRNLFVVANVPNTYKGALILMKDDLFNYAEELISYPYAVLSEERLLYQDLTISHGQMPLIIKISAHLNIDLLSTDMELLRNVSRRLSLEPFVVKLYRGTVDL